MASAIPAAVFGFAGSLIWNKTELENNSVVTRIVLSALRCVGYACAVSIMSPWHSLFHSLFLVVPFVVANMIAYIHAGPRVLWITFIALVIHILSLLGVFTDDGGRIDHIYVFAMTIFQLCLYVPQVRT